MCLLYLQCERVFIGHSGDGEGRVWSDGAFIKISRRARAAAHPNRKNHHHELESDDGTCAAPSCHIISSHPMTCFYLLTHLLRVGKCYKSFNTTKLIMK